jgi:DMSO/TMAO reductase YedYZ molybdopterin-dependent catalytic subunit
MRRALVRALAERRGVKAPPGPFRSGFWRSPLRGPWLTTVLGTLLLGGVTVVALTGFLSHAAYEPGLGRNGIVDPSRDLPLGIGWPAAPAWLYALTQGLHVNVGLATVPLLLAKLWSVIPRLFAWPPVTSPAQAIERASITLLVASAGFEFATGIINAQNYYPFNFSFVVAHYYGGVVFIASLAVHIVVKLPVMVRAYRERGGHGLPEPPDPDGLVARDPAPPTITRRGLLGFVGAGSGLLLLVNAGQSIGGPLRPLALLAPRGGDPGPGPNGFHVNKTAAGARITPEMTGDAYRLVLRSGDRALRLSRAQLLAMEQRTETLPIACVEGWTTTQRWTGVPLATLAGVVGAAGASELLVESLQPRGGFRQATLSRTQFGNERALLALKVNGADLSLDHGFPARVIVPALPGVHNTKWVGAMTFTGAA